MPSRFVVCFTTMDGVRADLHAYADGDGSLRDNNHFAWAQMPYEGGCAE